MDVEMWNSEGDDSVISTVFVSSCGLYVPVLWWLDSTRWLVFSKLLLYFTMVYDTDCITVDAACLPVLIDVGDIDDNLRSRYLIVWFLRLFMCCNTVSVSFSMWCCQMVTVIPDFNAVPRVDFLVFFVYRVVIRDNLIISRRHA